MATIQAPAPYIEPVVDAGPVRQILRMVAPIVVLVVAATAMALLGSQLVERLELPGDDAEATTAVSEAVIRPGNGPSVAATARSRIVGTACWLSDPIEVAADGTGAFIVTAGAGNVHCPGAEFREGFTLRWPAAHQPRTRPL